MVEDIHLCLSKYIWAAKIKVKYVFKGWDAASLKISASEVVLHKLFLTALPLSLKILVYPLA